MRIAKSVQRMVASGIVSGFMAFATWSSASAQDEMAVNIAIYPPSTFQMMIYVAEAKGFYKDAGLKPSIIVVPTGVTMQSMMASGAIDFSFQPPSNVGVVRERGMDQVMVVGNMKMPWVVIARKDLKLPHKGSYPAVIRDLKGLKWGVVARGGDNEIFMRVMAGDAKLDVDKDVTWIPVGLAPTALPALKAGRVDVVITLSPAPTVATVLGFGQVVLDLRKGEGPGNFKGIVYQGMVTLRKIAEAKPKAIAAIIAAHAKAYCWIHDNRNFNELVTLLKQKLPAGGLSEAQFEQMVREEIDVLTLTIPESDFVVWNDLLLRYHTLKAPLLTKDVLWKTVPKAEPKC